MSLRGQGRGWKNVDLFEREARLLRGLKHPGIPDLVDAFDVDTPTDRIYVLVQRLAPGATLQALVEGGRWRPDEAEIERIAARMLDILTYLHGRRPQVIHRDIKPSNVVYDPPSGDVFLIDFGAVRETLLDGSTMVGTFGYMSPEQYMGRTSAVSDLYSLGATLLFLLSGRTPSDLPQRGLRVDWESVVVAGPRLRALLGGVLDPDPDGRVTDAQQAAALLRGETLRGAATAGSSSTATLAKRDARTAGAVGGFLPRRKPAGTRIEIVRNGTQSLLVDVPPMSWRGETLMMAGFTTFWLGFIGTWTGGAFPPRVLSSGRGGCCRCCHAAAALSWLPTCRTMNLTPAARASLHRFATPQASFWQACRSWLRSPFPSGRRAARWRRTCTPPSWFGSS
jgi:serine/threonine protein kinase